MEGGFEDFSSPVTGRKYTWEIKLPQLCYPIITIDIAIVRMHIFSSIP
jgi:hypothetical protein